MSNMGMCYGLCQYGYVLYSLRQYGYVLLLMSIWVCAIAYDNMGMCYCLCQYGYVKNDNNIHLVN